MIALTGFKRVALRLCTEKAGAVATEYAFLIAFIAIVAAIGMVLLGENLSTFFADIGNALQEMVGQVPEIPGGGS